MNLSVLIGKIVLSTKGEIIGYTRYPIFSSDFSTLIAMQCTDVKDSLFYLPISFLPAHNKPFVYSKRVKKTPKNVYSPLGRTAYTNKGEKLGTVTDLYLCGTRAKYLYIDGKAYSVQQVSAFGDCILLNFRKKIKCDDPFRLVGKTLKSEIVASNQYRIQKGEQITSKALQFFIEERKLVELTLRSL